MADSDFPEPTVSGSVSELATVNPGAIDIDSLRDVLVERLTVRYRALGKTFFLGGDAYDSTYKNIDTTWGNPYEELAEQIIDALPPTARTQTVAEGINLIPFVNWVESSGNFPVRLDADEVTADLRNNIVEMAIANIYAMEPMVWQFLSGKQIEDLGNKIVDDYEMSNNGQVGLLEDIINSESVLSSFQLFADVADEPVWDLYSGENLGENAYRSSLNTFLQTDVGREQMANFGLATSGPVDAVDVVTPAASANSSSGSFGGALAEIQTQYGTRGSGSASVTTFDDVVTLFQLQGINAWSNIIADSSNPDSAAYQVLTERRIRVPRYLNNLTTQELFEVSDDTRTLSQIYRMPYTATREQLLSIHTNLMLAGMYEKINAFPLVEGDPTDPAFQRAYQTFISDAIATGNANNLAGYNKQLQDNNLARVQSFIDDIGRDDISNAANAFSRSVLGRNLNEQEMTFVINQVKNMDAQTLVEEPGQFNSMFVSATRSAVEQVAPREAEGYTTTADTSRLLASLAQTPNLLSSIERGAATPTVEDVEQELRGALNE